MAEAYVFLHVCFLKLPYQPPAWPPPPPDPLDKFDGIEVKAPLLAVESKWYARRVVERLDREFQIGNHLWGHNQWFSYVSQMMLTAEEQKLIGAMDSWIADAHSWGADWITPILSAAHECLKQLRQSRPQVPPQLPQTDPRPALLQKGGTWIVRYGATEAPVKNLVGLRYIAYLLSRPNEDVSVDAFPADVVMAPPDGGTQTQQLASDHVALQSFAARLQELKEERHEANKGGDLAELERIDRETDDIREALQANTRLGGALRTIDDETDRTRQRVSRAIDRAISALGDIDSQLGAHLFNAISTGATCRYRPPEPLIWRTDFSVEP